MSARARNLRHIVPKLCAVCSRVARCDPNPRSVAWDRYHGNVEALVKEGVTDKNRGQVVAAIRKHVQAIESLRDKVA